MILLVSIVLAVVAVTTTVLMFPVRAVLRRAGVVDKPNARSSHQVPTIRGGGVAIVAVIAGALGLLSGSQITVRWGPPGARSVSWLLSDDFDVRLLVLLCAFVALAIVSFIDDLKGLPARVRFAVHAGCALAAVGCLVTSNGQPMTVDATTIGLGFVAILWIAGYTNAFNFMDGINGIAGMQALTTGLGSAAIAHAAGVDAAHPVSMIGLVIAGAALGFLPHNFPRARVFMGDVSSAPLGFLLAVLAFWIARLTSWWMLFWVALLHANFVLDTGITLVRRAVRGDRLSEAHREHFYQRLVRAGSTHTRVTLSEFGLQVVATVALWLATPASPAVRLAVVVGVIAVWLGFFAFAEGVFRKATRGTAVTGESPVNR